MTAAPIEQEHYTDEEIAELRRQLREGSEAAKAEARKRGVTLHPRIAEARAAQDQEPRVAVIYRTDIDIPRGKGEVQFGHAVAMLIHSDPDAFIDYLDGLQLKLSLEVADEVVLTRILDRANARGIPAVRVVDAGRTVFGKPTLTCIGVGPMDKTDCNAITRGAKLRA